MHCPVYEKYIYIIILKIHVFFYFLKYSEYIVFTHMEIFANRNIIQYSYSNEMVYIGK